MWDETNFLFKGFIDEVKGSLTESSGSESVGAVIGLEMRSVSKGANRLRVLNAGTNYFNLVDMGLDSSFVQNN